MKKRVSMITGAACGIGLAIAEAMAKNGDRVILGDLLFSDKQICAKVSKKVGSACLLQEIDITDSAQVDRFIADIVRQFGRIDCLINSVGIVKPVPVYEMSDADWDLTMAVNLRGAFLLSRAVAKPMMKQKLGRIVHIGSTASFTAAAGIAAYVASKHGLVGLVRGMACDLAPFGITVNAICPGNTATEMFEAILSQRAKHQKCTIKDVRDEIISKTPLGRIGIPEDVVAAVLYLASNAAEFVTGQTLTVDGGRSLNLI